MKTYYCPVLLPTLPSNVFVHSPPAGGGLVGGTGGKTPEGWNCGRNWVGDGNEGTAPRAVRVSRGERKREAQTRAYEWGRKLAESTNGLLFFCARGKWTKSGSAPAWRRSPAHSPARKKKRGGGTFSAERRGKRFRCPQRPTDAHPGGGWPRAVPAHSEVATNPGLCQPEPEHHCLDSHLSSESMAPGCPSHLRNPTDALNMIYQSLGHHGLDCHPTLELLTPVRKDDRDVGAWACRPHP